MKIRKEGGNGARTQDLRKINDQNGALLGNSVTKKVGKVQKRLGKKRGGDPRLRLKGEARQLIGRNRKGEGGRNHAMEEKGKRAREDPSSSVGGV